MVETGIIRARIRSADRIQRYFDVKMPASTQDAHTRSAMTEALSVTGSRLLVSALLLAALSWMLAQSTTLPRDGALSIVVFAAAMLGWTVLRLPQTAVAVAAALAAVATGAVEAEALYASLGSEIVWLMLGAFVIAAALARSGLTAVLTGRLVARCATVSGLFWASTLAIFATAFLIPSTSARAAALRPVFEALRPGLDRRAVRALGLLFPTVILFSAAAALTGAGAHLVATDFIRAGGMDLIGYGRWLLLAAPFALLSSLVACATLLLVFLRRDERRAPLCVSVPPVQPLRAADWRLVGVVAATIALWASERLHGLGLGVVAMLGALAATTPLVSGLSFRKALAAVDWDLILFLAATLTLGQALVGSGAADWLASGVAGLWAGAAAPPSWLVLSFVVVASALAHLVIVSRTARVAVLVPALALPLSGLGVNPAVLILASTLASGFCQTFLVSAKPVAIFGGGEDPAFGQRDLLRLSFWLLPPFVVALVGFALFYWPLLGMAH
jgi:solute carrier family 13 (sodium-dependent dicarboxylate transporter), member 2/3/5